MIRRFLNWIFLFSLKVKKLYKQKKIMTAVKMPPQLDCNPLVKENNEDREYRKHLKKV